MYTNVYIFVIMPSSIRFQHSENIVLNGSDVRPVDVVFVFNIEMQMMHNRVCDVLIRLFLLCTWQPIQIYNLNVVQFMVYIHLDFGIVWLVAFSIFIQRVIKVVNFIVTLGNKPQSTIHEISTNNESSHTSNMEWSLGFRCVYHLALFIFVCYCFLFFFSMLFLS